MWGMKSSEAWCTVFVGQKYSISWKMVKKSKNLGRKIILQTNFAFFKPQIPPKTQN